MIKFQVLSIGDDEPERKAAAYVRQEMSELVCGLKLIKMIGHPDINEISIQLEYLIRNLREYIQSATPFDVLFKLEDIGLQDKAIETIQKCNSRSDVIRRLLQKELTPDLPDVKDAETDPDGGVLELLSKCVFEVPHSVPPDPPNPFEAALIQFELKFEQFHKLFTHLRHPVSAQSSLDKEELDREAQATLSEPCSSRPADIPGSPIVCPQLIEAAKNRIGLQDCIARHVENLIDTNPEELIFLGKDCLSFLHQIQNDLPIIFNSKCEAEDIASEESVGSAGWSDRIAMSGFFLYHDYLNFYSVSKIIIVLNV